MAAQAGWPAWQPSSKYVDSLSPSIQANTLLHFSSSADTLSETSSLAKNSSAAQCSCSGRWNSEAAGTRSKVQ